jgi:hypothetical protein
MRKSHFRDDGEYGRKNQKMTKFKANFRLVKVSKSVKVMPIYKA